MSRICRCCPRPATGGGRMCHGAVCGFNQCQSVSDGRRCENPCSDAPRNVMCTTHSPAPKICRCCPRPATGGGRMCHGAVCGFNQCQSVSDRRRCENPCSDAPRNVMCTTHTPAPNRSPAPLPPTPAPERADEALHRRCLRIVQQVGQAPERRDVMHRMREVRALVDAAVARADYRAVADLGLKLEDMRRASAQLPLSEEDYLTLRDRHAQLVRDLQERCAELSANGQFAALDDSTADLADLERLDLANLILPVGGPLPPAPVRTAAPAGPSSAELQRQAEQVLAQAALASRRRELQLRITAMQAAFNAAEAAENKDAALINYIGQELVALKLESAQLAPSEEESGTPSDTHTHLQLPTDAGADAPSPVQQSGEKAAAAAEAAPLPDTSTRAMQVIDGCEVSFDAAQIFPVVVRNTDGSKCTITGLQRVILQRFVNSSDAPVTMDLTMTVGLESSNAVAMNGALTAGMSLLSAKLGGLWAAFTVARESATETHAVTALPRTSVTATQEVLEGYMTYPKLSMENLGRRDKVKHHFRIHSPNFTVESRALDSPAPVLDMSDRGSLHAGGAAPLPPVLPPSQSAEKLVAAAEEAPPPAPTTAAPAAAAARPTLTIEGFGGPFDPAQTFPIAVRDPADGAKVTITGVETISLRGASNSTDAPLTLRFEKIIGLNATGAVRFSGAIVAGLSFLSAQVAAFGAFPDIASSEEVEYSVNVPPHTEMTVTQQVLAGYMTYAMTVLENIGRVAPVRHAFRIHAQAIKVDTRALP